MVVVIETIALSPSAAAKPGLIDIYDSENNRAAY